jgi:hypothetical protein
MSESAFTFQRRGGAYIGSPEDRQGPSPEQLARMEPWEHALFVTTETDAELYRKLKREDELGNPDELMPGDRSYDDGPGDWSNT